MDRRLFLRRAALIAAGAVALDQLEVLEQLTWQRSLFPGADIRPTLTRSGWRFDPKDNVFVGTFDRNGLIRIENNVITVPQKLPRWATSGLQRGRLVSA